MLYLESRGMLKVIQNMTKNQQNNEEQENIDDLFDFPTAKSVTASEIMHVVE